MKLVKDLQDLLGEIHDCDVQLPEVAAFLAELMAEDVAAAGESPKDLAQAPNRRAYAGLVALQVHLRARRNALFEQFLELWRDYERKGFAARLAFADLRTGTIRVVSSTERGRRRAGSLRRPTCTSTASCRGSSSTRACSSWPRTRASRCSSA